MIKRLVAIALLALPATLFASGKIYTWTDEDGNTQFGDRPPAAVDAKEIAVQGKKKKPVVVDEEAIPGKWFGTDDGGGEVKIIINAGGTISFIQTRANQSVYNYQGIWSYEDKSIMVITEFTQEAPPNGDFKRSVEPIQLQYNILKFGDENMELMIDGVRFTISRVDF